jgi:hydrogenase expression/formation protein HypD
MHENFRDRGIAERLLTTLKAHPPRQLRIMEVCGTHTMAISQYGIRGTLPEWIKFLSGPGCPVCVTPTRMVDCAIEMSRRKEVIVLTFGDMMRVPGTESNLERERARGAGIHVVYSPLDGLQMAKQLKDKLIVFMGVGFETTSPTFAATVKRADAEGIGNFFVIPCFKLIPPAIKAILSAGEVRVDGFMLPGHVSAIIGSEDYRFIPEEYGIPCVIAGFEPVDILQAVLLMLEQIDSGPRVEIGYSRSVRPEGNRVAQALLWEVFSPCASEWRGLGVIEESGLRFGREYERFDATKRVEVDLPESKDPEECICGAILKGLRLPEECTLFGTRCTPSSPVGPCMVSSEGTCAAHYKYEGKRFRG